MSNKEHTGGKVSYYTVHVARPTKAGRAPYDAECNDIIEALDMSFAEGEAFKAIWRKAAARTLALSKASHSGGLYDAEKAEFYGGRMAIIERGRRDDAAQSPLARNEGLDAASIGAIIHGTGRVSIKVAEQGSPIPQAFNAIDDDSPRAQALGQNGNTGEHHAHDVRVHAAHCCLAHGCKFGDLDCPVVEGHIASKYLCQECHP